MAGGGRGWGLGLVHRGEPGYRSVASARKKCWKTVVVVLRRTIFFPSSIGKEEKDFSVSVGDSWGSGMKGPRGQRSSWSSKPGSPESGALETS